MTATITLYCDHHDDTRRGCLAQYTASLDELLSPREQAAKYGWQHRWEHGSRDVDLCPKHAGAAR